MCVCVCVCVCEQGVYLSLSICVCECMCVCENDEAARLSAMSLWFSKCKAKDREGKDRQSNGHLFSSGSCAGATVCLVCDKPATGKDLLHCSSEYTHA